MFLRLGVTSFGGPIAHLGYFRTEFVERRKWLGDSAYADLVALCQFLPGPTSSQVGMAVGLQRAGTLGLIAAWVGFTLPSAILLVAFAFGVAGLGDVADAGWLLGLKAAAAAVVAHAVLGMARTLTPDARRAVIAVGVFVPILLLPGMLTTILALVGAGLAGLFLVRRADTNVEPSDGLAIRTSRRAGILALAAFAVLLGGLPILGRLGENGAIGMIDVFYRAGSLVFGGGHVVLPLLQAETVTPGLVDPDVFLAGYGAAQAVPGPLFTFAGFLGASWPTAPSGVVGAILALVAIFLPSALLMIGVLPFWDHLRRIPTVRQILMGVNAGVVGLLAAALYDPIFVQGVTSTAGFVVAAVAFVSLSAWRLPSWLVVAGSVVLGVLLL